MRFSSFFTLLFTWTVIAASDQVFASLRATTGRHRLETRADIPAPETIRIHPPNLTIAGDSSSDFSGVSIDHPGTGYFKSVGAKFKVPAMISSSDPSSTGECASSIIMGLIGGTGSPFGLDVGVDFKFSDGTMHYTAWFLLAGLLARPITFSNFRIHGGDELEIRAYTTTEGTCTVYIENYTDPQVAASEHLVSPFPMLAKHAAWILTKSPLNEPQLPYGDIPVLSLTGTAAVSSTGTVFLPGTSNIEVKNLEHRFRPVTIIDVIADKITIFSFRP